MKGGGDEPIWTKRRFLGALSANGSEVSGGLCFCLAVWTGPLDAMRAVRILYDARMPDTPPAVVESVDGLCVHIAVVAGIAGRFRNFNPATSRHDPASRQMRSKIVLERESGAAMAAWAINLRERWSNGGCEKG